MKNLLSDFRTFVMRGNVLDLAVAVVIGIATPWSIRSSTT
jgi:large-conductance mechanosensitive channel